MRMWGVREVVKGQVTGYPPVLSFAVLGDRRSTQVELS